jgi:hypothetical protein
MQILAQSSGQGVIFVPVKRQHVPPQVSGQSQEQVAAVCRLPSAGVIRGLLFTGRFTRHLGAMVQLAQ